MHSCLRIAKSGNNPILKRPCEEPMRFKFVSNETLAAAIERFNFPQIDQPAVITPFDIACEIFMGAELMAAKTKFT